MPDSIRSSYCDGSAADSALRNTRWQWGAYRAARLACFRTSNLCETRNRCNTSAFRVESSRHLHALPQHSVAARVRNDLSGRPTRRQFRWCQVRRIIWRQDMLGRSLIQHRAPGKRRVRGTRSFARFNIRRRGSFSLTGKCLSCRRQTPPRSPKMSWTGSQMPMHDCKMCTLRYTGVWNTRKTSDSFLMAIPFPSRKNRHGARKTAYTPDFIRTYVAA